MHERHSSRQSYTWVDTKQGLDLVVAHLNTVSEVAIDLEQHSFRSFQGFVCLMQISTRTRDFLIDTLVLRSQMQVLNEYVIAWRCRRCCCCTSITLALTQPLHS